MGFRLLGGVSVVFDSGFGVPVRFVFSEKGGVNPEPLNPKPQALTSSSEGGLQGLRAGSGVVARTYRLHLAGSWVRAMMLLSKPVGNQQTATKGAAVRVWGSGWCV